MAKTYNNFGVNRAKVTPTVTLATGAVTPFGSSSTNLAASTTLLGNTYGKGIQLRRKDKIFYHRMRDYVANILYPTNPDRIVNELGGTSSTGRGFWRQKKVDISLANNKAAIGVASTATIDPNSEAWKQWVGKQHIGFPMNDYYDYYAGQSARLSTNQDAQYMHDNMPQYIQTITENSNNYQASSGAVNAAVAQGSSRFMINKPDFTPFCCVTSLTISEDHQLNSMNTLHPLVDSLSGCTVGQKYSVSDLLAIFRDLFFNEVLDYVNHPTQVRDFTALKDLVYAQLSPTNKQPYINLATIPNVSGVSLRSMLETLGYLQTLGSPLTGGATGLIHFEGTYHSGVAGFETIERLMSAGTITAAYAEGVLTTNQYDGTATFSKQGRVGALRALLMVIPDNIKRKQYELGLTTTQPNEVYSGLMSIRPLGKFSTLSTADGWASEVRLKETQLSLVAFGVARFATGSSSIGTVVNPEGTQLVLSTGLNCTSFRPMASYTKLNSVDFTISGQNCKIFGFADFLNVTTQQYTTPARCAELETMGNLDPSIGDKILPTLSPLSTISDTHQVRLCVVVPFELSGMVKDGSGNVPYFTLAEGSSIVLNNWTSKAAFAYIQGSYHVYTRIMNFAQMKAIHGATKTFEECMDLATTAFINECRNYFDVAETDPNPVEQLMAYTPLNSVGYNLPAIRSYVKPQYDYRPYPQNAALDGAPNLALIKKSSRIGGMYFGGTGVRIDGLQKFVYGTRGSSSAVHSTTVSTSVDMYIQWLGGGAFLPPLMDGAIGYYYGGEREQVKTKWGGGRLFRLNNSDQTLDTFKYSGRMGFRAASLNTNVLSYGGAYRYIRNPYSANTPTIQAYTLSPLTRPSYNSERTYSVQAEISPELVNSYLQTVAIGRSFQKAAADYGAYALITTTYAVAFPDKGTVYDFISDATRTVKGIARKDDIPTQFLPVRLYDRATGELLAHQLSQAGGLYKFYGLQKNRRYSLVVLDPQRDFNSVIEDVEVILT